MKFSLAAVWFDLRFQCLLAQIEECHHLKITCVKFLKKWSYLKRRYKLWVHTYFILYKSIFSPWKWQKYVTVFSQNCNSGFLGIHCRGSETDKLSKPYGLPDFGKRAAISKYVRYIFVQKMVQKLCWLSEIYNFGPPLHYIQENNLMRVKKDGSY